jgi:hypothetical protein
VIGMPRSARGSQTRLGAATGRDLDVEHAKGAAVGVTGEDELGPADSKRDTLLIFRPALI